MGGGEGGGGGENFENGRKLEFGPNLAIPPSPPDGQFGMSNILI